MRSSDPGGSSGDAFGPDRGSRRRVTLRDGPYRARSLGGGAQVVVNLADHAAQIASSSVGPRRRRRWSDARRLERGAAGRGAPRVETRGAVSSSYGGPEVQTEHLLRAAVTTDVDALWQVRPRRLLEYSPGDLHTVGWFPWLSKYHVSVTVFASPELHAQTLALAAWTAAIHVTGLGVADANQGNFKAIFGTAYLGSLASMGVIIALVLGLFISLVVQRWWDVRVQYATFHHALLELAVAFAASADGVAEPSASGAAATRRGPRKKKRAALRRDATRELFRLLNLAHVLFLSQAGEREHAVTGARRLRRAGRLFSFRGRTRSTRGRSSSPATEDASRETTAGDPHGQTVISDDSRSAADDARDDAAEMTDVSADSDSVATPKREPTTPFRTTETVRQSDETTSSPDPIARSISRRRCRDGNRPRARTDSVASTAVFADDANILSKHVTHLDRDDCVALGLVTEEEWDALSAARAAGLPRFVAVLCWARGLLERSAAASLCPAETKRAAAAKLADARQAAGRVSTYLASQLPYTYVNLVSLVVHVYLFVLATWFGFVLHSGLTSAETEVEVVQAGAAEPGETISSITSTTSTTSTNATPAFFVRVGESSSTMSSLSSDVLAVTFCYAFLAFSNVLFQGLLHIHALLDNPFGHHPAKFPLRQFVAQLAGQTSALLAGAHEPPECSPSVRVFRARSEGERGGAREGTDETEEETEEEREEFRA